jgi:8-oxo-dGTP diphosphatase
MIYDNENRVLIQNKIRSKWSGITFPGGHVDDGESIYDSTIREVKEETGLTISSLEQVGLIHMFNPENQDRRIIFLYKTSHYHGEVIDETHEGKVYWVSLHELDNMQLAPNMREYLKVFLNNDISEAYITPNSEFIFLPKK